MHDEADPTMIVVSTAGLSMADLAGMALSLTTQTTEQTPANLVPVQEFWQSVGMSLWAEHERRRVPDGGRVA